MAAYGMLALSLEALLVEVVAHGIFVYLAPMGLAVKFIIQSHMAFAVVDGGGEVAARLGSDGTASQDLEVLDVDGVVAHAGRKLVIDGEHLVVVAHEAPGGGYGPAATQGAAIVTLLEESKIVTGGVLGMVDAQSGHHFVRTQHPVNIHTIGQRGVG